MDERAKKRKLDEIEESDIGGVEKEFPKQGLKLAENKSKKQKTDAQTPAALSSGLDAKNTSAVLCSEVDTNMLKKSKSEQMKLKLQRKKERLAKRAEKQQLRKIKEAEQKTEPAEGYIQIDADGLSATDEEKGEFALNGSEPVVAAKPEGVEVDVLAKGNDNQGSTASPSPPRASPTFDNPTNPSTSTSTSSVIPPATAPKHIKIPTDPELLKSRLAARIEALRAARRADGPNGAPARNRQELMEARRKKEEQRRAHKKALRLKAKQEEEARREEALASARDSPTSSMMSPAIYSSSENNFSFGRVTFSDGQQLSNDLSGLLSAPKRKGPQDPATALLAREKKRLRLAGLDEDKRTDIEEKDLWLSAKKRAHGEKVRDDTNLLKKTLRRKEKAKKKSEKDWATRTEGVRKGQEMKHKKREENIRKRKEEKVSKGSKGSSKGKSGKGGKPKPKNRPGFEGSFVSGRKR
jgi:hypothetical protein